MYYIYGHFLDNKCIYIGSNCVGKSDNRAYNFRNRNQDYAKITKNRKHEINVKFLRIFTDEEIESGISVQSEEMKMIAEYHDRGEALCSHQDMRGINLGRAMSDEVKKKHSDALKGRIPWNKGKHLTKEHRFKTSLSMKGRPSPMKGRKVSEESKNKNRESQLGRKWINNGIITKKVTEGDLEMYLQAGWTLGRNLYE